ncbi:MAG: amino acid racemase [Deltaproteobacteria bacterium]|nr:amino acid racemase [Deltaproteobacteria bacterium]
MAKHIGIVACSAEGAALCYRTICMEATHVMGEHCHPEITMHTYPLSEYMIHIRSGAWGKVAGLMLSSTEKLYRAGAEFAVCPDNTIHEAFALVQRKSPIPWLHIAESVAAEAGRRGYKKLAVLGTKYLMTGPVYPDALRKFGIGYEIPDPQERDKIDDIIFTELVNAVLTEQSRLFFNDVMARLKVRGCDAAVLGCTEIPLIINTQDAPLPTLDSTRLLARAALRKALQEDF